MTKIEIYIGEEEKAELQALAKSHGLSLADVFRRGGRLYFDALAVTSLPPTKRGRKPKNREEAQAA